MTTSNQCRGGFLSVVLVIFAGCASLPDATVRYYLTETKVSFKVVRTVACDGQNHLVLTNAVTPVPVNLVDRNTAHEIPLGKLKGTASDADVKLEFYDGGRLKSFNATTTGEGEAILKTVISVVSAVFAYDGGSKQYPTECALIKKLGGEKPLTLTYAGDVNVNNASAQPIKADPTSLSYDSELSSALGKVCATVEDKTVPQAPVSYTAKSGETVLTAREPAAVKINVTTGSEGKCGNLSIWNGEVLVGQLGKSYVLPIPTPVLFGKEAMGATFGDSGALSSVQFTSNTGAGQALNVASAAEQAAKPESTVQKAQDVKAEADLIAQQQRLVGCLADPKNCK